MSTDRAAERADDQPPGIDPHGTDLPAAAEAAERVRAFLSWFGDGRVDEYEDMNGPPLFARDLEAVAQAVLADRPTTLRRPAR